jgi:hypothetical protein
LDVSPTALALEAAQPTSQVTTDQLQYRRLPPNTFWILVHDPVAYLGKNNYRYLERSVFDQQSAELYATLSKLGAQEFVPPEGYYSHEMFIAPWSSHQQILGDQIKIPLRDGSRYEVRWGQVHYYRYEGIWQKIQAVIDSYSAQDIGIYAFDSSGNQAFTKNQLK